MWGFVWAIILAAETNEPPAVSARGSLVVHSLLLYATPNSTGTEFVQPRYQR
jgi:hypothetical protein